MCSDYARMHRFLNVTSLARDSVFAFAARVALDSARAGPGAPG
jgi:hypothetical protein